MTQQNLDFGTAAANDGETLFAGFTKVQANFDELYELLSGGLSVKQFGAVGDSVTDDTAAIQAAVDECFGTTASPHGSDSTLNKTLYFPPGNYVVTSPITFRSVQGGRIIGAGKHATIVRNSSTGSVFATNGFAFNRVEGLYLYATGTAPAFDLNWDNTGTVSLQSNTFVDVLFQAGASGIGIEIGRDDYMGSENLFLNCYWSGGAGCVGLKTSNFNALSQTVIGGNVAGCAKGLWAWKGTITNIIGTAFQNGANTYDILIEFGSAGGCFVSGCRTESDNFFQQLSAVITYAHLTQCTQEAASAGVFAHTNSPIIIDLCASNNGVINSNSAGVLYMRGGSFPAGYLAGFTGEFGAMPGSQFQVMDSPTVGARIFSDGANRLGVSKFDGGAQIYIDGDGQAIFASSGVLTLGSGATFVPLGGATSSFPAIKRNGAGLDFRVADDSAYCDVTGKSALFTGQVSVGGAGVQFGAGTESYLQSGGVDGNFVVKNAAGTDFGRFQFGGTTSSFPSLKRSGTTLIHRLADDSADAPVQASVLNRSAPVTESGSNTHTVAATTTSLICDRGATVTVTLPTASSFTGRELYIKTIQAFTVVSNASNVAPSTSATAGTAILPATDGAWAILQSDGTNWVIMAANPLV